MALDWLKMRSNLDTDPRVAVVAAQLGLDPLDVVGRVWKLWAIADQHSVDGALAHYTPASVDLALRAPGISAALVTVGWLEFTDDGAAVPKFDQHNGETAKKRGLDAIRKAKQRTKSAPCPRDVRDVSAETRTDRGRLGDQEQEQEQEQERGSTHTAPARPEVVLGGPIPLDTLVPPDDPNALTASQVTRYAEEPEFATFLATYPSHRRKRRPAEIAWAKARHRGHTGAAIVSGLAPWLTCPDWVQEPKYTPSAANWLDGDCFADPPPVAVAPAAPSSARSTAGEKTMDAARRALERARERDQRAAPVSA